MSDKRLLLDKVSRSTYVEPLPASKFVPHKVARKREEGNPFEGQERVELLGFNVKEGITLVECLPIIKTYGEFVFLPAKDLWALVRKKYPKKTWCYMFDDAQRATKISGQSFGSMQDIGFRQRFF